MTKTIKTDSQYLLKLVGAIITRSIQPSEHPMSSHNIPLAAAELDRLDTWAKYTANMCHSCVSSCCTLPVEVRITDLIRIGVVDEFERGEPPKNIAKRLQKDGLLVHEWQESEQGPPRKYYETTAKGDEVVAHTAKKITELNAALKKL